mmetsp:Transcript_11722/g.29690  ORF Transcript_11722/g.29690 Transcript_11722/m.29690 type:complete len:239 (+) Transcript_11722:1087-1803(+)
MEFGTSSVVGNASKDDDSSGVTAGSQLHVSCHKKRSVEFGSSTGSNIDAAGVREVPQHTLGHAGRESTCAITHPAVPMHCSSLNVNASASMDIDQNGLALAIIAKVNGMSAEKAVLVGKDVENLDFVRVATSVVCCSIIIGDGSSRWERLPILRFLLPDVHHLFVKREIVVWVMTHSSARLPSLCITGGSLVNEVAFHPRSLVEDLNISVEHDTSSDLDTISTRARKHVCSYANANEI